MKQKMIHLLVLILISVLVVSIWKMLELCMTGKTETRDVDNIMGTILVVSLYNNWKAYRYWRISRTN